MMLSQLYNRRGSLEAARKDQPSQQEEDIINSFYEERKSRSTTNAKQHNLLRKNISYFQKDQDSPDKPDLKPSLPTRNNAKISQIPTQPLPNFTQLAKPPMPLSRTAPVEPKSVKPAPQAIPALPLKQMPCPSAVSSNFSPLQLSKTGSQQQDFKAQLKNELNRRINIQHYLSEISHDNKENTSKPPSSPNQKLTQFKLKYNYDSSVPQRIPTEAIPEELSRISNHNGSAEGSIHESRQSSITNILQQDQPNNFEFSRNSLTDRIQHHPSRDQSFSQYRMSVPTLGDSAHRSNNSSRKTEKDSAGRIRDSASHQRESRESTGRNVLTGEELSELQENSHPIREEGSESQPTTQKHGLKFFQPEVQAEYKRKLGDLERELAELRSQRKREDKFILSIQKMRMLMDGTDEECSLKELWRWIKALPQRK